MKIVKRPEFLAMPPGTLYSEYEHCSFGDLNIKNESLANDWFYQQLVGAIEASDSGEWTDKLFDAAENGTSVTMDFDTASRDGCFESPDKMFAVWEQADVQTLIEKLQSTIRSPFECICPKCGLRHGIESEHPGTF